jgi:CRP-like cAMP-binding protein
MRGFGDIRSFAAGERLMTAGHVAPGLFIILARRVVGAEHNQLGAQEHIVTHGHGNFMGELAQMAGRPALANATADEAVEAFIIPPERLRALMIAEAELGERIMRALILRRVAIVQTPSRPPAGGALSGSRRQKPPRPRNTIATTTAALARFCRRLCRSWYPRPVPNMSRSPSR